MESYGGPNGAFIRIKDDTKTKWSPWRELLFKDYADKGYILNQKSTAQAADLWITGAAKIGDSVVLNRYKNNVAGDSILTTDAAGNLKLKLMTAGSGNIYTTDGTLTGNRILNTGPLSLSFNGVNSSKDSSYMLFGYRGVKLGTLSSPFVGGGIAQLSTDMYEGARITWSKKDTTAYILANRYGVGTAYARGLINFQNTVDASGISWVYRGGGAQTAYNQLSFAMDTLGLTFIRSGTASPDTLFTIDKYGTTVFAGQVEARGIYQASKRSLQEGYRTI